MTGTACRVADNRHCPLVYEGPCGGRPCARFESDDETPWLPEISADLWLQDLRRKARSGRRVSEPTPPARNRGGRPTVLTPDRHARVAELRAAGMPVAAIATTLGISRSSVYVALKAIA